MATVVLTRPLPETGLATLRRTHDLVVYDPAVDGDADEDRLIALADGAEALISTVADPITARVLAAASHLQIVAQFGVGIDNIDLDAARAHGIVITHTPGVLTDATADFTFALLLAVARNVLQADRFVREGRFVRWETKTMLGMGLYDKTLGIVGLGRIGTAVARRAIGFGMNVLYHNRRRANPTLERETGARYVPFGELLERSDVLSLHCSLNDDSRGLLDAGALGRMKPHALLINTSRGAVVDEAALIAALEKGRIAGAGLDVFDREPAVPAALLRHPRVVVSPHLASATVEARTSMAFMAAEAVLAVLDRTGEIPYRVA